MARPSAAGARGILTASLAAAVVVACGGSELPGLDWGAPATLASDAALTTAPRVAVDADGTVTACWSQAGLPGALPADAPVIAYARNTAASAWSAAQPSPTLAAAADTQITMAAVVVAGGDTVCPFRLHGVGPDLIEALVLPAGHAAAIDGIHGAIGLVDQLTFAANSRGTRAAAWVELVGTVPRVLFAMRLPFTGWTQPIEVQDDSAASGDQPALAVDESDRMMIAWREATAGAAVVRARTAALSGAVPDLGPDERTDAQTTQADQRQPRLAALGNGTFVALWEERSAGASGYGLRASRFESTGWSGQNSSVDPGAADTDQARVHAGPNGSALAVWRRGGGVWASRQTAAGWSFPLALARGLTGTADELDSAVDAAGNAVAVWVQRGTVDDLYYGRFASGTAEASLPLLLESGSDDVRAPSIAMNARGVAAVAWLRAVGGQSQPDVLARVVR